MTIPYCWDIDEENEEIRHVDGVLSYGTGTGTQPAVGEFIIGATSGAIGRVISTTGTVTTGTLTLTDVVGKFQSGETLDIMSELGFDGITANGGFEVGDTISGNSSSSTIDVKFITYNYEDSDGEGTIYGTSMSAAFTDNEQLDISGGQSDVADARGTGTDNDTKFDATTTSALVPPGPTDENNSVIIHYDGGTIDIPVDARVTSVTSGAVGKVAAVYGATATGSLRIVDSDTSGSSPWTDDETLRILDCVYYDNLVAGKVFEANQYVKGSVSGTEGRVLYVIDDGDSTGKLVLGDETGTGWVNTDNIQSKVDGVWTTWAGVEDSQNMYLDAATLNLPSGTIIDEQLESQGGIYPSGSINIVRSSNNFFSYLQDVADELDWLDDKIAVDGKVRDSLYVILGSWRIPDLSFRFLDSGSWRNSANTDVWTNVQTTLTHPTVGDHGFLYDSSNPTPQPNIYIEQDERVLDQFWMEGSINVLVKNKTRTDVRYIDPNVTTLGQLINDGKLLTLCREYLYTYGHFETSVVGSLAAPPISCDDDLDNTTGTHQISYTGTGGFTVGEVIVGGTTGARGIVVDEDTTGDTLDYVLKTPGTQFGSAETITGEVSSATCTFSSVSNLVAGYGTDIRLAVVDRKFVESVPVSGTFVYGENCTQSGSSWEGYFMAVDSSGDCYFMDANSNAPSTGQITGSVSGATFTPASNATQSTYPFDIGDGSGTENYTGLVCPDITDADPQSINNCHEWQKYNTAKESTTLIGGPGTAASGTEGRIFRALQPTYAEDIISPIGRSNGGSVFYAQGWCVVKEDLDVADIQNFKTKTNDGDVRTPPNLQAVQLLGVEDGVRCAIYRTAAADSETIQRTEFQVGAVGSGYNQSGDTKILIAAQDRSVSPLPSDVPDAGVVRALDPNDTGNYLRFPYDTIDRTNNWVELTSGTIGAVTGGQDLVLADDLHICLLEEEATGSSVSNTLQYVANINVYWVARKKGYLPSKGTGTFGTTGFSANANLQDDEVVNMP
jgi:hypothetical protein